MNGHLRNHPATALSVQLLDMRLDVPRAHPAHVHRDDLLVKTRKTPLVFADQHQVESALAVPGDVQHDPLAARVDRLGAGPVTMVAGVAFGRTAQM